MNITREKTDLSVVTDLARHLAFAPVAFAVTKGPTHVVRYANSAFRRLQESGDIIIGQDASSEDRRSANLTPLLDRAFREAEIIRDELLAPPEGASRWHCTVWPIVVDPGTPQGLVIEVRDAAYVEGAIARQRAIAERLLLGALRHQDTARQATETGHRAEFLAAASRDLARSLDQDATREVIQRSTLPREGTWCIVDIVESSGAIHRLAVIHPDPAKQELVKALADQWFPKPEQPEDILNLVRRAGGKPIAITPDSEAALISAVHGAENLAVLRRLGFGALLVVPLIARDTVLGTITFVTPEGGAPFSADEIALASDLADRCAMALENARLYREADALRASADEANRAKSEFLSKMSHELRTPLNAIGGYVELIELAKKSLTEEQRSNLSRIKHNQEHLVTLISQLLSFVRTESGRMEYRFAEIPVQAALNDVGEMLDGLIRDRGLRLDLRPGDASVAVWADADRIRQILMNLVMNAVKYTKAGGGSITIGFTATADEVHIQVADAGPGIPAEKLEAIFDPFVQLTNGLEQRQGGVGLGLAISRDLARAMKGDLTVESTVGVGSRFTLTLPRARRGSSQS